MKGYSILEKELRRVGLRFRDLADQLGITRFQLSNILHGRTYLTLEMERRIGEIVKVKKCDRCGLISDSREVGNKVLCVNCAFIYIERNIR